MSVTMPGVFTSFLHGCMMHDHPDVRGSAGLRHQLVAGAAVAED
jgi:hypothetical protein